MPPVDESLPVTPQVYGTTPDTGNGEVLPPYGAPVPPILPVSPNLSKVAVIVGNEVAEVMAISEKTKAALLSNPIFVDLGMNVDRIIDGDEYDATTGKFTKFEEILQKQAEEALAQQNATTPATGV